MPFLYLSFTYPLELGGVLSHPFGLDSLEVCFSLVLNSLDGYIKHLFDKFYQADTTRKEEGNGLGLSIAKSLTELCGGTFELTLDGDLYKVKISFPETEN